MQVLTFLVLVISLKLFAKPKVKIGIIYPPTTSEMNSIGKEAFCITKGVFETPPYKSFDVEYSFIEVQQRIPDIISKISKIKDIDIFVGTVSSSQALAVLKIINYDIPLIVPTASHPSVTSGKNSNTISVSETDLETAKKFGKYIVEEVKPKKLVTVVNISKVNQVEFIEQVLNQVKNSELKASLVSKEIINGFQGYSKLVKEILKEKPDTVILATNSIPAIKIYNELAVKGFKGKLLGGGSIGGRADFLKALTPETNSLTLTFFKTDYDALKNINTEQYLKLHKSFCHGQNHTMVTVSAFDAANLALKLINSSVKSNKSFIDKMKNFKFKGITGKLNLGERNFTKNLYLYQIKNKETKFWKSIKP